MSISIKALTESDDRVEDFINQEFSDYAMQNKVSLNFEEFCFVAEDDDHNILGVIIGRALYNEVHIQDLIISKNHRKSGLGSKLITKVEETFSGMGYDIITVDTYDFQAPDFYPKFGFRTDFIRKTNDPKLSKYFFSKKI